MNLSRSFTVQSGSNKNIPHVQSRLKHEFSSYSPGQSRAIGSVKATIGLCKLEYFTKLNYLRPFGDDFPYKNHGFQMIPGFGRTTWGREMIIPHPTRGSHRGNLSFPPEAVVPMPPSLSGGCILDIVPNFDGFFRWSDRKHPNKPMSLMGFKGI